MLRMLAGAPPVLLHRLTLRDQLAIEAGQLRLDECELEGSFSPSDGGALTQSGGSVEAQTLHRIKLMSYVKWRSAFHERIRRREVLERCARRIMQRSLSGAYQAWVHFTLVRLEQKATY